MRFEKPSGYTGRLWEEEVLGPGYTEPWNEKKFWTFDDSFQFALDHQPPGWDPTEPETKVASDLHFWVARNLGLEDLSELKLYNCRHMPLDRYFGTDAFFDYRGVIYTLDLTVNRDKTEAKANYIWDPEVADLALAAKLVAEGIAKRAGRSAA